MTGDPPDGPLVRHYVFVPEGESPPPGYVEVAPETWMPAEPEP